MNRYLIAGGVGVLLIAAQTAVAASSGALFAPVSYTDADIAPITERISSTSADMTGQENPTTMARKVLADGGFETTQVEHTPDGGHTETVTTYRPDGAKLGEVVRITRPNGDVTVRSYIYTQPGTDGQYTRALDEYTIKGGCMQSKAPSGLESKCITWGPGTTTLVGALPGIVVSTTALVGLLDATVDDSSSPS